MSTMILLIFKLHSPSLSLTSRETNCSGGSNISRTFSVHHGSLQLSHSQHQLDGGDAAHWWTISSDDCISVDLTHDGQSSTEPGYVGAHRLCPTHQSAQDHCSVRYHLFFSQTHEMSIDLSLPHLNFLTDLHFQLPLWQLLLHLRRQLSTFVISQF